jgi:hypothetical protein
MQGGAAEMPPLFFADVMVRDIRSNNNAGTETIDVKAQQRERAIARLRPEEPVPFIERRTVDNPELSRGQRASDVPLVMNGDVAFLTPAGYIETASSLVVILQFLDLRERGLK